MALAIITQERLKERLHYDPESGLFTWISGFHVPKIGTNAGSLTSQGYLRIKIDRREYSCHRLAWLYMHGEWPEQVDHINGEKRDNRFCNLRNCTPSQNSQNKRKARKGTLSGLLGASKCRSYWRSFIFVKGKNICLGNFQTPEAAHAAYVEAKRRLHPFGEL